MTNFPRHAINITHMGSHQATIQISKGSTIDGGCSSNPLDPNLKFDFLRPIRSMTEGEFSTNGGGPLDQVYESAFWSLHYGIWYSNKYTFSPKEGPVYFNQVGYKGDIGKITYDPA